MRYFSRPLTRQGSDRLADLIEAGFARDGWGLWAMEEQATGSFLGFTGLARPAFEAPFTPAVEVGWRLSRAAWGFGFATEAGRAVAALAFEELGLEELVSYTADGNARSRAVMRRLGMRHNPTRTSINRTFPRAVSAVTCSTDWRRRNGALRREVSLRRSKGKTDL